MIRRFLSFAIWAALPVAACSPQKERNNGLRLASVRLEEGWGYRITLNNQSMIYQPYIPAVPGRQTFRNEADALRTGRLVIHKLTHHQAPALTRHELDSLRIQL